MHLRDRRGAERLGLELGEVRGERGAELRFDQGCDLVERARRHAVLQRREGRAHARREHVVTERCELTRLGEEALEIAERPRDALRRSRAARVAPQRPRVRRGESVEWTLHDLDCDDRGQAAEEPQRLGHAERAQPEAGRHPHPRSRRPGEAAGVAHLQGFRFG